MAPFIRHQILKILDKKETDKAFVYVYSTFLLNIQKLLGKVLGYTVDLIVDHARSNC